MLHLWIFQTRTSHCTVLFLLKEWDKKKTKKTFIWHFYLAETSSPLAVSWKHHSWMSHRLHSSAKSCRVTSRCVVNTARLRSSWAVTWYQEKIKTKSYLIEISANVLINQVEWINGAPWFMNSALHEGHDLSSATPAEKEGKPQRTCW